MIDLSSPVHSRLRAILDGATVLITGGTGSFGKRMAATLLRAGTKVKVLSRDELKQSSMRVQLPSAHYIIGDTRDRAALDRACEGVDYVFHAAALKQVPTLEEFPSEALKTNVIGSANVFDAAVEHGVECVVALSTDKAAGGAINAYGMSKALMEKLVLAMPESDTSFRVTRYGNVLGSRGSVVPIFQEQLKTGSVLTLTHPAMTRFLMTLDDAVELALRALLDGTDGGAPSIWIKKAPACTVEVLADACIQLYAGGKDVARKIVGIRPGEKFHETLVGAHEMMFATSLDANGSTTGDLNYGYYVIDPSSAGASAPTTTWHAYTSDSTRRLDVDEVVAMLEKAEKE